MMAALPCHLPPAFSRPDPRRVTPLAHRLAALDLLGPLARSDARRQREFREFDPRLGRAIDHLDIADEMERAPITRNQGRTTP